MKKTVLAVLIAVIAFAGLAGVGVAYAQGSGPDNGTTNESGMKGTRGANRSADRQAMGLSNQGASAGTQDGILHDGIMTYFSKALDISVSDLEARLADGETMLDISSLTVEEFQAKMLEARTAAIAQAVTDGTLTLEQADWMTSHGFGQMSGGAAGGGRGANGTGQGQFSNPDCPLYVAP